ncbi:MAG: hypothetical protein HKN68_19785, partial [Saprospiraceae bacterium]|nr:hypothetical protein [Saprospiraceae bacterium]
LTNWTLDVRFDEDGYMFIAGDPKTKYAETAPLAYTLASPNKDAASNIIFKENDNGKVKYMLTSGFNSYFKLKWWETTKVHLIYSMALFTIFILFLLYNLINLFRKKSPDANSVYRRVYNCSVTATLFHLITFLTIGFYLYVSDGLVFDFGLPWFLRVLMVLPIVAIILTLFSIYGHKSVLNEWSISKFKKIIFTVNLIALVLIVPFLYYWNLLGFNY